MLHATLITDSNSIYGFIPEYFEGDTINMFVQDDANGHVRSIKFIRLSNDTIESFVPINSKRPAIHIL
jgi:hypothetical protein